MSANRILLGHLLKNGDCIHATTVARQIKHDFPGCHLTWAVSSLCRPILENNPLIDEIWEIPLAGWDGWDQIKAWRAFEEEALRRYRAGGYDFIFFTQIHIGSPYLFDGSVRPSTLRGYPGKITVPLQPVLQLRPEEVAQVDAFAQEHRLQDYDQVVLFECSPQSDQSDLTPARALKLAEVIATKKPGRFAVILSSQKAFASHRAAIIDGSRLSLRQMAGLTRYCTLFIGCSSGISHVITSTAATRQLPMIEVLDGGRSMYASLAHDYAHWGLPPAHVLEMFNPEDGKITACFDDFINKGWDETRRLHHEEVAVNFSYYLQYARDNIVGQYDLLGFCLSLAATVERYGWRPELEAGLRALAGKYYGPESPLLTADTESLLDELRELAQVRGLYANIQSPFRTSQLLRPPPASLRLSTCPIVLRRDRFEMKKFLEALTLPSGEDNAGLLEVLLGKDAVRQTALLREKHAGDWGYEMVAILALMQQGEYARAWEKLGLRKENGGNPGSPLFEELRGDLNWMRGNHDEALLAYETAITNEEKNAALKRKIEILERRGKGAPPVSPPETPAGMALVFYEENAAGDSKDRVRRLLVQVAKWNGKVAALGVRNSDCACCALIEEEELRSGGYSLDLRRAGRIFDSRELMIAVLRWARANGTKWAVLTDTESMADPYLQSELAKQFGPAPEETRLFDWRLDRSKIEEPFALSRQRNLYPCLLALPVEWLEVNLEKIPPKKLGTPHWLPFLAVQVGKLTDPQFLATGLEIEWPKESSIRVRWLKGLARRFGPEFAAIVAWRYSKLVYG